MKKILLSLFIGSFCITSLWAQNVGINSTGVAPDASAGLDVSFTDKGVLIPRVDISDLSTAAPITSPATSLVVYNTNTTTGPGYFYWDGSKWVKLFDSNDGKPWLLTGNSGTTVGTNFLGTTDDVSLSFKTNNTERMRILNTGNVGIGTTSPTYPFTVTSATEDITGAFYNTESSTDNYAVYGECSVSDYYGYGGVFRGGYMGVRAYVNPSGSHYYWGVYGSVSGGSGTNFGVYGYTYGSGTNLGVRGYAYGSGTNYGVYGSASGGSDRGVYGRVYGTGDHAIYGYNSTTSTTQDYTTSAIYAYNTYNVDGVTSGTIYNAAIMGFAVPPNNHDAIGVWGQCWPSNYWGYGGWFEGGYYGVRAVGYTGNYYKSSNSNNAYSGGMLAKGAIGVNSIGGKIGLITVSNGIGIISVGNSENNDPAAYFEGDVVRKGYEAMVVNTGESNVATYTAVSDKVTIQSFGQGRIINGQASVQFNYEFSSVVSSNNPIIVIITPTSSQTRDLVVTNTTVNGFEVSASDPFVSGSFNWLAIGQVKGYENVNIKQEYIENYIENEAGKIYPSSKDFDSFRSPEFFRTEKTKEAKMKEDEEIEKDPKLKNLEAPILNEATKENSSQETLPEPGLDPLPNAENKK